jgi:hypothetical protein
MQLMGVTSNREVNAAGWQQSRPPRATCWHSFMGKPKIGACALILDVLHAGFSRRARRLASHDMESGLLCMEKDAEYQVS